MRNWKQQRLGNVSETFVGRSKELQDIQEVLSSYVQHPSKKKAGAIFLSGEAGIGKTRLAEEIASWAQERCWCVVWCWLDEQHGSQVYGAWSSLLRTICTQLPWILDEISAHPDVLISLTELLPELNEWSLGKQQKGFQGGADRLWDVIATVLRWIGQRTKLLLVIDDVHWLDGKSRDVLQFLFHQHDLPLTLLGTYREAELSQAHAFRRLVSEWRREHLLHIVVTPLDGEQLEMLLNQYPDLDKSRKQTIILQAGGNPLFAEELAFSHSQQDQETQIVWTISPSVDAIFACRLSSLSFKCYSLLEQAAIFGNMFEHAWLLYITEKSGMMTEDQTLDALEEALEARLLVEVKQGSKIVYQFWHPLLQEYLYRELSTARSQILHRSAAVSLAAQANDHEEYAAIIVHHLLCGEAAPRLITQWAERAGHRAYRLAAYPEAENFYKIALEHLEGTDPGRALLAERLGECCAAQGNAHASCYFYERAILWRSAEQSVQAFARKALLWCEISFSWRYQGNIAEAMASRKQAIIYLELLPMGKQTACRAMLFYLDASLLWQAGRHEDAFLRAQEAASLFQHLLQDTSQQEEGELCESTRIERSLIGSELDLARAQTLLGTLAIILAHYEQARAYLEAALLVFERQQALREIAKGSCNLGDLLLRVGAYDEAQQHLTRAYALAEQIGNQTILLAALGNLGILAFRRGNLQEAQHLLARALALAEQTDDPEYVYSCLIPASYAEQDLGNWGEAAQLLLRALSLCRKYALAGKEILVAIGRLRLLQAQFEEHAGRTGKHLRTRAIWTLRRALREHLELEFRLEGEVLLGEALVKGDEREAERLLLAVCDTAQQHTIFWPGVLAQRLLRQIAIHQDQKEKQEE